VSVLIFLERRWTLGEIKPKEAKPRRGYRNSLLSGRERERERERERGRERHILHKI